MVIRFGIRQDRNAFDLWYDSYGDDVYLREIQAPMYYRGANAAIICYDITSLASWNMVDSWLQELRRNMTTKLGMFLLIKSG